VYFAQLCAYRPESFAQDWNFNMMRVAHVNPKCGRIFTSRSHDHANGAFSTDVMGWHGNNLSRISVFGISLPLPSREVLLLKHIEKSKGRPH
jgi:hypothetical protein